ncbi:MAG: AmmeMemoRadiSam system radical SAM enzyme [Desulfuromonadales bacterium]
MFWEKAPAGKVKCSLCRFGCTIPDGRRGLCGVRENRGGTLTTLVYGQAIAEHIDPIEKKPLFHYHPGSQSLSVAAAGCNFRCLHCQNYQISQLSSCQAIPGQPLSPAEIVRRAQASGCLSISYTYTEPTIFYEYAFDTAVLAHEHEIGNVFVTNGYIGEAALRHIAPYLDAANVDLKGFSEKFYGEITGATLQGVLDSLRIYKQLGIWLEITTLIIPGHNDSDADLQGIARFIADELGPEVPWHVTAFHPTYRMLDCPPTPMETLRRARRIGRDAGLQYVYQGNLPGEGGENTYCPGCGQSVIERSGFRLGAIRLRDGRCIHCATPVAGIGMSAPPSGSRHS